MIKKRILLIVIIITAFHTSIAYTQEIKERAMTVLWPKPSIYQKAKTFAATIDFGTSLFMRQDPKYESLSECNACLDLNIAYGYFFNRYFYAGPGGGVRAYFGERFTMFPLFGELRGYWRRAFIYGRGGYSFSTAGNNDAGGAYAAVGLGVNFISTSKYKLFLSTGYEFQDHRRRDTSVLRKEVLTGKSGVAIRIGTVF